MRVRVWMTIHLCSKELEDVSRMVRKISLKKTWRGGGDQTWVWKETGALAMITANIS